MKFDININEFSLKSDVILWNTLHWPPFSVKPLKRIDVGTPFKMSFEEIKYDLYFAVFLTNHDKNVLIPDFWCNDFDLAGAINGILNKNKNHLIFFSPDINKYPDFTLPVRETLDLETDGCYFGKILRAFSEYTTV